MTSGVIIPFHKDVVDIPANYSLCDGTNGTPDIRDRFVLCAGPNNAAHSFGGTLNHTHGITIDSVGEHAHTQESGGTYLTEAPLTAHAHNNALVDAVDKLLNHGGV